MYLVKDILSARSAAVVGASANPGKMGHTLLSNLLRGGFEGSVYPINPREESILGRKCYPSIVDVPGEVDLAVVCVPAGHVAGVLEQAAAKGVKGAILISGGFREIGNTDAESELLAIAGRSGMRLIGPNCQGVNYTANRLCATWPCVTARGAVGVVSVGAVSLGLLAIGALAAGIAAFGGFALGALAIGGIAVGLLALDQRPAEELLNGARASRPGSALSPAPSGPR